MAASGGKEQAERTIFHLLLQQITVVLGASGIFPVYVKLEVWLHKACHEPFIGVSLPIQSECEKMRTKINSVFGDFHAVSKRNKSIFLWMLWKKSQKFLKICREEPVLEFLHCKVAACISF